MAKITRKKIERELRERFENEIADSVTAHLDENHRDIKSTLRYAHVLDDDVAAAVERIAKSRKKSRTKVREAS